MRDLTFGPFVRRQYHAGDDMRKRFEEVKAQVRLADQLIVGRASHSWRTFSCAPSDPLN
ncbi:MAG: hypothetical protein QOJ17_1380 [Rhodospirillaceae bacterium]|nr:hypothetical protein [Rhodospirillaceae bacterium]